MTGIDEHVRVREESNMYNSTNTQILRWIRVKEKTKHYLNKQEKQSTKSQESANSSQ
jgi:hypothetical protein